MTQLPARIDDLPASLVDVAETLGLRVVLGLITHFGGLEVKFPAKPAPDHAIIKALGGEDGYALCSYLGGQAVYVPKRAFRISAEEIARLEAQGYNRQAIARLLDTSQRHVRRVANRDSSADDDQGDLFD